MPRLLDFDNQIRIAPTPERLLRLYVNRAFSLGTRNGNGQVRFAGRAVNVRISRNEKSLLNRRTEGLDDRRMYSRFGEGVFLCKDRST